MYIDYLLVRLSNANVGCFIGSNYVGALAYADDLVLLVPTASALRKGLGILLDRSTTFCASLVRCPVTSRHAYLEHIALVSMGVNFGICRAAVCLLSVRCGTKL